MLLEIVILPKTCHNGCIIDLERLEFIKWFLKHCGYRYDVGKNFFDHFECYECGEELDLHSKIYEVI